jgi:hypothetical protein
MKLTLHTKSNIDNNYTYKYSTFFLVWPRLSLIGQFPLKGLQMATLKLIFFFGRNNNNRCSLKQIYLPLTHQMSTWENYWVI